jgi:hypothetical protein
MKHRSLLFLAFCAAALACNKSNVQTGIVIRSIGPSVVSRTDLLRIDLAFTDKNDKGLDSVYLFMHVVNQNQRGTSNEFKQLKFEIPAYPSTVKGDLQITFARQQGVTNYPLYPDPATAQNDTTLFSFSIKDAQNHMSDTVASNKTIVILSQ